MSTVSDLKREAEGPYQTYLTSGQIPRCGALRQPEDTGINLPALSYVGAVCLSPLPPSSYVAFLLSSFFGRRFADVSTCHHPRMRSQLQAHTYLRSTAIYLGRTENAEMNEETTGGFYPVNHFECIYTVAVCVLNGGCLFRMVSQETLKHAKVT